MASQICLLKDHKEPKIQVLKVAKNSIKRKLSQKKCHSASIFQALAQVCNLLILNFCMDKCIKRLRQHFLRRIQFMTKNSTQQSNFSFSSFTSLGTWLVQTMKRIKRTLKFYKLTYFTTISLLSLNLLSKCLTTRNITSSSCMISSNSTISCWKCSTNTVKVKF